MGQGTLLWPHRAISWTKNIKCMEQKQQKCI